MRTLKMMTKILFFCLGLLVFSTNIIRYAKLPVDVLAPQNVAFGILVGGFFLGLAIFLPNPEE